MKVLIVDDNSENLYLLESILKGSGYITLSANNGAEALGLARKDIPDLIITDILMPVMDGFTLCREFKNDENLCNVPFIFYTATYSDPRDEELALNLGADRFILKPRDPEEFIAIIKELLKEEKKKNIKRTEVSSIPETVILKEYNEVLVRKLEDKMLKIEQSEKEIRKNNILLLKEIEERKRAENAIVENEKFLKETQKIAQLGSYAMDVNTGIWKSSEILDSIFGIEPDFDKSVDGWTSIIHPEWQHLMADYFANGVIGLKKPFDKEYKIIRKSDKTERWVHGLGELVIDKENKPIKIIGTIRDITELKNAEQEIVNLNRVYALLSNTNQAIVRIKDRQKLFDEICRIAIDNGKFRMAWIGIVNNDTNKVDVTASAGLIENYLEDINLDLSNEIRSESPTGKAIKNGTNSIANDIENDKDMLPWKENTLRLGYKSSAAFPLNVFDKVIGVFSIYASQKDFFHQQEIRLLDEMAMDISFALEFLETEKNKIKTEESLSQSEERFRTLYENSTIGLYRTTPGGEILLANPTLVKLLGYSSFKELAVRNLEKDGFEPDYDRRLFIERIEMDNEVKGFESAWTRKDGTIVYVLESAKAIRDSKGQTLYYDGSVEDITKRRIAQDALKESELRFKQISDYTEEWIWEVDKNGLYTYSSPIVKNILGYELEELIGKKYFYDFFDPEIKENLMQGALGAFANKASFKDFVNCNIHKDGRKIILSTSGIPIIDKENNLIGYRGVDVDITERKRAEDELLASKLIIEGIINTIPVRVFWKDKNLVYLGCNTIFAADAGFSNPQEIIGKDDYQMGWRDQAELYRADDRNVIESGKSKLLIEEPQTTPEGKIITLLTSKIPLRDSKGKITGLLGTYVDITDRKLAEEKLQESEERFRVASESLTDIIYDWDIKENIDWYGDIDGLMGYSPGKFPRTLEAWAVSVHPEDKDRVWAALESHLKGVAPYIIEYRIARKDGELRWWSVRGIALRNDQGEPYKMIGSITDITEQKEFQTRLKFKSDLLSHVGQAVIVTDLQGKVIYWNKAAEDIYGWSSAEAMGQNIVTLIPTEQAKEQAIEIMKELSDGNSWSGEFLVKRKNGSIFPAYVIDSPIIDSNGKLTGIIGISSDITERKLAVEALSNERSLLRTIIDLIPDAIYAVDIEGRKILANVKEIQLSGKNSEDEIIGKTDFDLYPESEAQRYYEADQIIIQSGKPTLNVEDTLISKDGQIHWLLGSKVPLRDVHGQITGIVGVNHDITERKQAEEVLRQERDFSRTIIETSPTFFVAIGSDGKTIMMNDSMLKTLGYTLSEVVGIDYLTNFVPVEDREKLSKIFEALATSNKSTLNENSILTKDGRKIIVEWHGKNILKPNGELNYFFGIGIDITERKRAEELLQESEERFRHSFDYAAIGICLVGTEGKFQKINNVFREMIGYEEDEIKNFTFSDITHPDDSSIGLSQLKKMLDGEIDSTSFEKRYIRKDRRIIWVYLSISLIRNVNHQPQFFITQIIDITERKQVEKALKESEKKFRLVWEKSAEGMRITNEEGIVVLVNDAYCKLVGKPLNDIEGKLMSVVHEEARQVEILLKHEEQFHSRNIPRYLEKEIILWNGKKLFAEVLNTFLEIENHPTLLLSIFKDISDRKRSEEALRDSEVRYRSLIQSANDAIITTDSKGIILDWNTGAEKIFGYLKAEVTGEKLDIIIPQGYLENHIDGIKRMEQGGEHHNLGRTVELQGLHKGGKKIPIELSLAEWESSSKKYFTGIIREITERKLNEKEIVMLANALRSVDQCVSITDMEDKIIFVNQSFLRTYGYMEDEIIGKNMSVFRSQKNPPALVEEILPSTLSGGWSGELWNKRKDGSEFLISLSTRLIEDKNEKFFGLIGVASDITERKSVESELIASKERAEEMSRLKSNFLANMSHELRTPLVGILGFADILRQDVESQENKAMAETIYTSGKRLSETLNLILDLSKFESEKLDIKSRKMDLVSKTEEIINSFEGTARKKGLTLKSAFSQDSIIINFEERAFHSILNNLINNALKFTSEGSVTTTIILNNDFVEIKVIDTGIGIAEQDYQNIFEEFRQASEGYNRNFEGSGLGLSITKKLVEKFGGTITVESKIGEGTTFKVILPAVNYEGTGRELTATETKIIPKFPEPKSVKPLALLVDDDPFVCTVMKRYGSEYIELETTVDADFAIKMLKKKQYNLIFMDINLRRGMDGKEATKKIRTIKGYESIPIIATTAYAMLGDKEEFLAAGCTHYLSKPFSQEEIVSLLEKVLKLV